MAAASPLDTLPLVCGFTVTICSAVSHRRIKFWKRIFRRNKSRPDSQTRTRECSREAVVTVKKYVLLLTAAAILSAAAYVVPGWAVGSIPQVELIYPTVGNISRNISAGGTVEELSRTDITIPIPVVIRNVRVSVGDTVEAGQVLADVDAAGTRSALLNLVQSVAALPEEYRDYADLLEEQYLQPLQDIAAAYGISDWTDSQTDSLLDSLIPSQILAPASGTVTSLSLSPGKLTAYGTAVGCISQPDRIRLHMSVDESDADRIQEGDTVVFRATATGEEKYVGTVSRVFPSATQTISGLTAQTVVGFYVTPVGEYSKLKPGYSVTGVVRKDAGQPSLFLPYEAILQDESNREYVYLYRDHRACRQYITTGEELSWGTAVLSGVTADDLVIANAADVISEGLVIPSASAE